MRVVYADSGLASDLGHHANACRLITAALRARGQSVSIAAWSQIAPELAVELDASRHFRLNTYQQADPDPICGWLTGFLSAAEIFAADLAALGPFTARDLLYVNSALPPQLFGAQRFLDGLPPDAHPHVVVELGTEPGLDLTTVEGTPVFHPRDPRLDARATLYRFAGRHIQSRAAPHLHIVTFDRGSSQLYQQLLGVPVATLPVPHIAAGAVRRRGGQGRRVVGVLGHQRGEKGYALMPAIADALLGRRDDVDLLVHNGAPDAMAAVQAAMRTLAAAQPRLELDERMAGGDLWAALLDRCDLILCPYPAAPFRAGYSAVASEAIAHGIPLVVPADTTLARVVDEFGTPGTSFAEHTPSAIVDATCQVLDVFDTFAERAVAAAAQWRETMGAINMVDAMLARIASADMAARLNNRSTQSGTAKAA